MMMNLYIYFAIGMSCCACMPCAALARLSVDVVIMCNTVVMCFQYATASLNKRCVCVCLIFVYAVCNVITARSNVE